MQRSVLLTFSCFALAAQLTYAGLALAQQAQPPMGVPPAAKAAPAGTAKPKTASPKSDGPAAAPASGGEASLRQRIEQLEEQLVDMNVVIGTLETLAKSGGASVPVRAPTASGGGLGASDAARLDGIETQIRALTAQLEQLSEQVRALGREPRRSDAGGYTAPAGPPPGQYGGGAPEPSAGKFGTTAVTTPSGDPIGSLLAGGSTAPPPQAPPPQAGQTAVATAPLAPVFDGQPAGDAGNPKQLYESAYGFLLQQDYGAAEAAFDDFLKRFPSDSLAGNAQYWLGESFFVRGQYKQAAAAFLKCYQTYGKSAKAPDSLLKLAMSLDRLGQKEAACTSYGELSAKFPTAPAHIKSRAQSERQRLSCG